MTHSIAIATRNIPGCLDLPHHLARLATLLDAERQEERLRLEEARGRLSLAEREARGLALADVEAVEEGALAGRALVTYARPGRPLGAGRIGIGSLVSVTLPPGGPGARARPRRGDRARGEARPDAPSGVVARRTRGAIAVAFDEPPPDWATDGRVVLELEPSPVTWERLASGIARLRDEEAGRRWHAVLSGGAARFLAAPRGPTLPHGAQPRAGRPRSTSPIGPRTSRSCTGRPAPARRRCSSR